MPVEILCVDDASGVAADYARLISAKTGLECRGTTDIDEALQLVAAEPVSVVVLDQRMPKMTGTALFREMKQIKPALKAIMLTGEADAQEAAEALSVLDYVSVIDKSQISELTPAVHMALARAEAERTISFNRVEIGKLGIHWLPIVSKSTLYLESVELVRDAHVPQNLWRFQSEINAGETKSVTRSYRSERNFTSISTIENSSEFKVQGEFSASKFLAIKSELNTKIANRLQTQFELRETRELVEKETINLPAEPQDPTAPAVKARVFYCGPEVMTLRLRIIEHHMPSDVEQEHWLLVDHHTGSFVNKQVDILTDGKKLERETSRWP